MVGRGPEARAHNGLVGAGFVDLAGLFLRFEFEYDGLVTGRIALDAVALGIEDQQFAIRTDPQRGAGPLLILAVLRGIGDGVVDDQVGGHTRIS